MSNAPSQRFGTAHGRRLPKDQRNSALWTPGLGRQSHNKEVSVDSQQLRVLQNLFETHPTLVAAKNVIESRLLAGGLTLRRNGQVVDLTPEFRQHINDHWTQFARDAIGAFLVGGFVVVSYEDEVPECATTRRRHKRARFQKDYKSAKDDSTIAAANGLLRQNVVPIVAPSDSYKLAFEMGGRAGYQRVYKVYKSEIDNGLGIDDEAMLFIRDSPDNNGNVNSPMAAVHHISSFVDGLINMASIAETSRAQPPLVTQIKKVDTHNGVAPADMFFDSESRGISRDQSHEDNAHNARALQMQLQLCAILNQASVGGPRAQMGPSTSSGAPTGAGEAASRLFTLPSDQEMVPHAPIPQTRADLEGLLRLSVDFMCTAIGAFPISTTLCSFCASPPAFKYYIPCAFIKLCAGVPSSLLFEGRYASRTTAQCVPTCPYSCLLVYLLTCSPIHTSVRWQTFSP